MNESKLGDEAVMRVVGVSSRPVLSGFAEYFYFGLLFYGLFGEPLGVAIPLVPAGGVLALAIYCVWCLNKSGSFSFKPIALPLSCAVSFLLIQSLVYGESIITNDGLRVFVVWMLSVIIVQSLCLSEGFFHRLAFAALGLGVACMPFLDLNYGGGDRAGIASVGGLANPNALASWFGFLSAYFFILGIESKRKIIRLVSLFIFIGCLFVIAITVTRGALFGVAVAVVVALRRRLKRRFFPVLIFTLAAGLFILSGLFDRAIGLYEERGTEETGRFLVWPLAIDRFFDSPIVGVGGAKIGTYVPGRGEITPHNSFLFFGLVSGVLPLLLYVAYWLKALRGAYRLSTQQLPESAFIPPLVIYTFVVNCVGASDFLYPWAVLILCTAVSAGASRSVSHLIMHQIGSHRTILYPRRKGGRTGYSTRLIKSPDSQRT